MFRLIPRLIFWELVQITLMALVGMSALLMMGGAMLEASRAGLDPVLVLSMMPYMIPPTLPYTLPTCLLFACTVVYGRWSANSELTALKAAGINMSVAIWPAVILAVAAAGAGVYMTDQFIPACNRAMTEMILGNLQNNLYAYLKQKPLVVPDFPYEVYAQNVRGDKLIRPIFKHRTSANGYDLVIQASEATLHVIQPSSVTGEPGRVVMRLINGAATTRGGNVVHFRDRTQEMPLPPLGTNTETKIESQTFSGCLEKEHWWRQQSRQAVFSAAEFTTATVLSGDPTLFTRKAAWNRRIAVRAERKARESAAEVQLRLAQSLVTIPFVLLGCPIGILFQRRDFLQSFFVCFLPIITIYYPLIILAYNIYKEGVGTPAFSLWIPGSLMVILAIPLLRRVVRF